MRMSFRLTAVATALLLAGCASSIPTVEDSVKQHTPVAWATEGEAVKHTVTSEPDYRWWTQFGDAALTTLIAQSLVDSPSLAQANARIDQARASARIAKTTSLPGLSASAGGYRTDGVTSESYSLDTSWELDFSGKRSMSAKAQQHRYFASDAAYKHARTRLSAEVASLYFEYRFCEQSVALAVESLASRRKTLELVRYKVDAGAEAKTTLFQVEAGVAEAENSVEAQLGACRRITQQLVALTAMPHAEVQRLLKEGAKGHVPSIEEVTFVSLPANVIRQRPDIAQLEQLVLAAAEEVGVAAAERLPSVSLTGSLSWTSLGGASTWGWGPRVNLPIFDGGRLRFGQERAVASYKEAQAAWAEAVLRAVQEVEDSLIRLNVSHKQVKSADLALARYNSVFASHEVRFQQGAASLLELEDARRSALAAKQTRLALSHEFTQARIALYKAAGGAWVSEN